VKIVLEMTYYVLARMLNPKHYTLLLLVLFFLFKTTSVWHKQNHCQMQSSLFWVPTNSHVFSRCLHEGDKATWAVRLFQIRATATGKCDHR